MEKEMKTGALARLEKEQNIGNLIFLFLIFALLVVSYYFDKIEIGISVTLFIVLIYNTLFSYEIRSVDQEFFILTGKVDDIQSILVEINDRLKNLENKE